MNQPENTRRIAGVDGYRVSSDGEVWTCRGKGKSLGISSTWHRLTGTINGAGYVCVTIFYPGKRVQRKVHQLVLESFVGPKPEGMESRHLNGNRSDNRLANLKWDSHKVNCSDRIRHGTHLSCEKHPRAKLTDNQVAEIRKLIDEGESKVGIASRFGVSDSTVYRIGHRKGWLPALA